MGVYDHEHKGSAGNKRERAKQSRSRRKAAAGQVNWGAFEWETFATLAIALALQGGAVRVGATRDGGAYALGIYKDNDYATEYIKPDEDISEALLEIADAWLDDWKLEMAHARNVLRGEAAKPD